MMKCVLKKFRILLIPLVVFCLFEKQALAQNRLALGLGASYLQPVGSLQNWFKGTTKAPQMQFVFNGTSGGYWQIFATTIHFDRPNTSKLFYKDLQLDLKLYGAGVAYVSYLSRPRWRLQPFWSTALTLYRWEATRGAYQTEDRLVPQRFQQAWSFAGSGGLGLEVQATRHLKFTANAQYHFVVAELWPALALHLENVSGLQMAIFTLNAQWYF